MIQPTLARSRATIVRPVEKTHQNANSYVGDQPETDSQDQICKSTGNRADNQANSGDTPDDHSHPPNFSRHLRQFE